MDIPRSYLPGKSPWQHLIKRFLRSKTATSENKKSDAGSEMIETDQSLRANGANYIDRNNETTTIIDRIEHSSATVIGIGGVRGAGKSSLAMKVLKSCHEKNYFTLLIISPTSYEPKEFLLSIYQDICEAVSLKIKQVRRTESALDSAARKRATISKAVLTTISVFGIVLFLIAVLWLTNLYQQQTGRINWLMSGWSDIWSSIPKGGIQAFGILILLFLMFSGLIALGHLIGSGAELLQQYPFHFGLHKITEAKLEWLIYQVKLSSSGELGVPKWNAKLMRGKELQDRPLSLPGITSNLNIYLEKVNNVFKKTVICIDELDKIDNPDELNELLKSIKGLLGQKDVHIILTVSKDAVTPIHNTYA